MPVESTLGTVRALPSNERSSKESLASGATPSYCNPPEPSAMLYQDRGRAIVTSHRMQQDSVKPSLLLAQHRCIALLPHRMRCPAYTEGELESIAHKTHQDIVEQLFLFWRNVVALRSFGIQCGAMCRQRKS